MRGSSIQVEHFALVAYLFGNSSVQLVKSALDDYNQVLWLVALLVV